MKASILAAFLVAFVCVSDAVAQGEPGRKVIADDGTILIPPTKLSEEDFREMEEFLGDSELGSLSTEQICDMAMAQIPSTWLGVADIGSFATFGLCPSAADLIGDALEGMFKEMKAACEDMTGITERTVLTRGCEVRALRFLNCTFKEPAVKPTCAGLRELCMSSKADGFLFPPADGEPGSVGGSFKIPGCTCVATYIFDEPRSNCQAPSPVSISQTYQP